MVVGGEEVVSIKEKYLLMWVVFVKWEFGDKECFSDERLFSEEDDGVYR